MDESLENPGLPCDGKLAFETREAAQASATVAEYQYGTRLRPYVCRYCGLWHLASRHDG
jgi:hypothetical protein